MVKIKNGNFTSTLVLFMGVAFILSGLFCMAGAIKNKNTLIGAAYRRDVLSDVISYKTESVISKLPQKRRDDTVYITEEIIDVDGYLIEYEGRYYTEPEGQIAHTVISDDGRTWRVYDAGKRKTIFNIVAGIVCVIVGGLILVFEYERTYKYRR
ncbi:DUF308 domain-containing protein [Butyrivibrio proteoclasticus]|uniref:DUF308 domain-containing protein n=1 Tax=Butyrivibrio proteoclasticus TaxID=43305 RepID=UPI00047D9D75|nr:DUF308 domain-containing protein [Butyrivibrio proteoclasticus]